VKGFVRFLRIGIPLAIVGPAAVFGLRGNWPWQRLQVAAPIVVSRAFAESSDTLRSGETLSDLFARNRVGDLALSALTGQVGVDPRRLRPGLVFAFRREMTDSFPSQILFRSGPESRISLERRGDSWEAQSLAIRWNTEVLRLEGNIDQSLYVALDEQVSDTTLNGNERVRLAWDLADTYMWQVDFTRDIRPGDGYQVLIERMVSEEGEVRFGRILAADLTISGKALAAFRFKDAKGTENFYDAEGNSLRRAFLRAPLQFRRISSNFSRSRFHPVLNRYRAHQGTDYAASSGTPVMAAGNGTVLRAGRSGGYGNLVELGHANGITTRYGHLRGFARGIRAGTRVTQGQVIGYVGSTGLATAAHLHYEFRVNGVAKDSRRIDVASGEPVARAERASFERERDALSARLYHQDVVIAIQVPPGPEGSAGPPVKGR
jgi:murein DD-endopeptidase MepM/ murein hydrolase activator NlpD